MTFDDPEALAIAQVSEELRASMTKHLELELQGLRPLRYFGWEIRLQECTFKQNWDEFMEGVRARRGESAGGKGKGSWGPKGKSKGGKESVLRHRPRHSV